MPQRLTANSGGQRRLLPVASVGAGSDVAVASGLVGWRSATATEAEAEAEAVAVADAEAEAERGLFLNGGRWA